MKPDARGGRRAVFVLAPFLAAVLVLVAITAVMHHNPATAAGNAITTRPATPPTPTTTTDATTPAMDAIAAVNTLHVDGVRYGTGILDRGTGRETIGPNGTTPFYAASVIKLFVVTYLLHEHEQGAIVLDDATMTDIDRALELSDDNAMDEMWLNYGEVSLIKDCITLFGLKDTRPPADWRQWGETEISARDVITVYQYVLTSLTPADSALVVGDLGRADNIGADGFNQAFGLLQPPRADAVKAKQGWMQIQNLGEMTLNTSGLLGTDNRYVVVILTEQPYAVGYPAGELNVNRASDLMVHALDP